MGLHFVCSFFVEHVRCRMQNTQHASRSTSLAPVNKKPRQTTLPASARNAGADPVPLLVSRMESRARAASAGPNGTECDTWEGPELRALPDGRGSARVLDWLQRKESRAR